MPECLFFSKNGFCTQSECLYLHIDPNSKIAECPLYNRGYCPDGPKCSKRHIRRVICPLYLLGFCPKGLECDLSHPKYEPSLSTPSLGKTDEDFMNELKKKKLELLKMKELKREREDSGDSLGKRQRIDY